MDIQEHRRPGDWRGEVEIWGEDLETGEKFRFGRNTITLSARKIMASLLGPKASAQVTLPGQPAAAMLVPDLEFLVTDVEWGSGSKPAERDDEGVEVPLVPAMVTPVAYPVSVDETSVTFQSSINPGDGPDDQEYSEVVLRAKNGRAFARFAFPAVRKFRQLRLSVRWQIFFA